MSKLLTLQTFSDNRGSLTVIEKVLPFDIKRVYYIYGVDNSIRGGHRHVETMQAAICINGSCTIYMNNGKTEEVYKLNNPDKCLLINPEDWHTMYDFSEDAILMVLASKNIDKNDYIFDKYE
jgi:dTDP-4-dehydrorhamnose 3,5-epimerase-like enzyme